MTTVTVSTKYQIVIPREARSSLGLRPGMRLSVVVDKRGGLRLKRQLDLEEIRQRTRGLRFDENDVRDESNREVP